MQICLNMIVKNEAANLLRCFKAVVPYISTWEIVDTGSTDGTPDLIRGYFSSRGIPGRLHHVPFENFSQARNAALSAARTGSHPWDYLLLTDADMELMVDAPDWQAELTGPVHDVLQRQGSLAYWNVRVVRRDCDAIYHGVTHEFFGHATTSHVRGIWFLDHASGGCRGDKIERDVRLLTGDLAVNPRNDRAWFYLAQSYKDLGRYQEAIEAYTRRIEIGGWDEEVWYATWMIGGCYAKLNDEGNFLKYALEAYNKRPWRAEPLNEVGNYFRHKGKNHAALPFIERGLKTPYPTEDVLFVEDHVYKSGLREEFSICGFYDNVSKGEAHRVCNDLALDRDVPGHVRDLARNNLFHYLQPLKAYAPSVHYTELNPPLPAPYTAMNPSICEWKGDLWVNLRAVNYRINEAGQYVYPDGDPFIRTRNFLFPLRNGELYELHELLFDPGVAYGEVIGLEDVRIWPDGDQLWGSATVLQLHPGHPRQMVKFRIYDEGGLETPSAVDLEELSAPNVCEKNWMPIIGSPHKFVYAMDRVFLDGHIANVVPASLSSRGEPNFSSDHFRGGGQCIPFDSGYLAIIHEAMNHQHYAKRMYAHRFVWMDANFALQKVSLPFVFFERQIEFAAGLAVVPGDRVRQIAVTFGVLDRQAFMATIDRDDVREMLGL